MSVEFNILLQFKENFRQLPALLLCIASSFMVFCLKIVLGSPAPNPIYNLVKLYCHLGFPLPLFRILYLCRKQECLSGLSTPFSIIAHSLVFQWSSIMAVLFFSSILVVLLRSCSMPLSLYVSLTWIFFSNKAYYLYLCLRWTALFIACILLAGSFLLFWTNPLIMLISMSFLLYLHFITWNYSLPFRVKVLPIFQSLDKLVTSHEELVQLFLHQWCTH